MIKGYKVRLFPTPEQEEKLWQHIHACRFVWNYMLAYQKEYYADCGKYLSHFDMIRLLSKIRHTYEFGWCKQISIMSMQAVCSDLNNAYLRYFEKITKFPKFKSKKQAKSTYAVRANAMYFVDDEVQIQKIGKLKFQTNYDLPQGREHKFSNARISYIANKWILSFGVECENQTSTLTDKPLGIDLGVKELAVVSFNGEQLAYKNINKSRTVKKLKTKLKHVQRVISRKYEVGNKLHPAKKWQKTNAIVKYEKLAKTIQYRLTNIRRNYIHQTTHSLVSLKPKVVGMEDLNVVGMMKNKHLSRAIGEQCFYEFIRQMKYKCEWAGIKFVQVPRFYASSKTCSHCGEIKQDLKLSDRMYKCPRCGATLDRDYNAAINLANYANAQLELA